MSKAGTYSSQGDDYQRAIAVSWIIELLANEKIEYIQVESNGLLNKNEKVTVDDIIVVYKDGTRRHIQAKKNHPTQRAWTINDWGSELPKILSQLEQGNHITVELYSSTSLGEFETLTEACRIFPNFSDFKRELSIVNKKALSTLEDEWQRSTNEIFNLLKRLQIGSHLNTKDWRKNNRTLLKQAVIHPERALDTLEAFINRHQSKDLSSKFEITSKDVLEEFASKGITRQPKYSEKEIVVQFQRTSAIGRKDWKRTIAGDKIIRSELDDILKNITGKKNTILVQDRPGSGKTCLLLDLADVIEQSNEFQLLFIKGDRFEKIDSAESLLPKEIVESCGALSCNSHVVVIIDSLDVLSCQRDHAALNFFLKIIDQLQIIQNVTVVAACREFDLKYDPRLRDRKWDVEIKLKDFDFQNTVLPILNKLNVNASQLNPDLEELLCLPQNLSLFEKVSGYSKVFYVRTTYELYNAFIDYTLKHDTDIEEQVLKMCVFSIVDKMLKEREHSISKTAIDIEEHILHSMISKGVLNEEAGVKIGFSHQTLFDNFVAGNALQNGTTLSKLILEHPPLPFFRPSVRSYLFFVRSQSFKAFSRNIRETLLNNEIAYHFKRLVVETYAEMIPVGDDWNLIRWMFLNQNDLFKRFFWVLKSKYWFELMATQWYPSLSHQPDSYEWRSTFINKLDTWMDFYPNEVVAIWNSVLSQDIGRDNVWIICHSLTRFKHYHVEGVRDLVYNLKDLPNTDFHFIGNIYCNYIEATGKGYDILWNWMTRDISVKEMNIRSKENELHCESHDLKDGNFLKKHLVNSEEFLNLVLNSLFDWNEKSQYWKEGGLTNKLLEYTSMPNNVSRMGSINIGNISILVQAVEEALLNHAKTNSDWWKKAEKEFRESKELAIRYILIKAYLENIETNLDGIISLLLDKELYESGELNFEIGLLINQSFHLLQEQIQDDIIRVIENLFSARTEEEEYLRNWYNRVRFDLFIRIPAYFRADTVNTFIDKYVKQFGYYEPVREKYTRGGFIGSPVSAETLDNLSINALYKLFTYYNDYNGNNYHPADEHKGGLRQLSSNILTLAKNNPAKYLRIINNPKFDEFSDSIIKPILEGVSSHIHCRLGKVNDSSYKPISPLVNINVIASHLLDAIEKKHSSFHNDITYARMLEYCIDALSTQEDLDRIIKLLAPLSVDPDPDGEKLNVRRPNDNNITAEDIANNSINCTRGIVGKSAIEVLNKLLDIEIRPFESVIDIIKQLALDKAREVRASLLWNLAYTCYKNKELGWQIFNIIFDKRQTHLWVLGETFLYNQYYGNFEMVKPCLDRIKKEALIEAGATWGRLSALCMIQGHINQQEYFEELIEVDTKDVWDGALSVFIANLEKNPDGLCQKSFREFIKENKISKEFGHKIDGAFRLDEKGKYINSETGKLFINFLTLDDDKIPRMHSFIDWIEYQAIINPLIALELSESLLSKLQSFESKSKFWHSKPLISSLTKILREADEMNDLELINRAVHLQDQFLLMGIDGMEEYLEEASRL
nr:AAA family ATPase [uncultured Draconibacterium sp.]